MAFYDKYIPKELKRPVDKLLDFGTDTFKKSGRAIRKLTPRELRPALPFLASAVPFMLPGSGVFMSGINRALTSSLANALSQEALDPEGDINLLSTGLAGLTGYMSAPELAGNVRAGIDVPATTAREAGIMAQSGVTPTGSVGELGFLQGAENIGREGIASLSDFVTGTGETFKKFGKDPGSLFDAGVKGARFPGVKELGKAIALPTAQATGDLAYSYANKAMRDFEENEAEELRQAGLNEEAIANARRDAIREAMEAAQFTEEDIIATFDEIGLKEGGRVGFREGGILGSLINPDPIREAMRFPTQQPLNNFGSFRPQLAQIPVFPRLNQLEQGVDRAEETLGRIRSRLGAEQTGPTQLTAIQPALGIQTPPNMLSILQQRHDLAQGMKDGGIMDLGGKEMDLRGGGFVPIGKKEKADDVPARLSKNEFVMTADAVRAAGGGSVNKGAQRMYNLMNQLEARA